MEVRDAVERDVPAMAGLTDAPESVLSNLVHDRSVRVAVDGEANGSPAQAGGEDDGSLAQAGSEDDHTLLGFVSFDAREDAVHVTEFGGDREACERLLAEPIRFAEREGLAVTVILPADAEPTTSTAGEGSDGAMRAALTERGFVDAGPGPRFRGTPTRRYRLDPS